MLKQVPRYEGSSSDRLVLALFAMAFGILIGCGSDKNVKPPEPPSVVVTDVVQKDVSIYQEWVGTMNGNTNADIRPKVEGFLLKQVYDDGAYVTSGQPLFRLDSRQAQAAVEQAQGHLERSRAALSQANIDVNRYTPLVVQKAISQAELDKALSAQRAAQAEVEASQAALDDAKLNLGWTNVSSPISGIAGIAKVGAGDLMTPTAVMATVSNVDPIYVDFSITEQDYLRFLREKSGNKAGKEAGKDLQLILGDGTIFPQRGHVFVVNREIDSRTGTLQVRAEFPNPGNVLRPGQYARIRAVTDLRKDAMVVPQRAINELQGVYQVGIVGPENKVTIKVVKLGPQFGDMWVIDSGVQPGDKVVVDGLQRLRDGITVAPKPFVDTQENATAGGD